MDPETLAKLTQHKTTLVKTAHGSVDLVFFPLARFQALQFNGPCEEMLEHCKGMCCGLRVGYNVILKPEEAGKFRSVPHPHYPNTFILESKPATQNCVYQDDGSGRCTIHTDKPVMCGAWHCSPGGLNSDGSVPKFRDTGWMISPLGGGIQDAQMVTNFPAGSAG